MTLKHCTLIQMSGTILSALSVSSLSQERPPYTPSKLYQAFCQKKYGLNSIKILGNT